MTDDQKIEAVEAALDLSAAEAELETALDRLRIQFGDDIAQKLWDEVCEQAIRECEAEA
ncbi:MAG: hypothetical protein WB249_02595 [Candidatus Sulfotelmatobacter sp.]